MSNSNFLASFNKVLIVIGLITYCITLAWCIIGVWPFTLSALKITYLMVKYGVPPNEITFDHNLYLFMCSLSAYYLFYNKTISVAFRRIPIAKPLIIIGLFFFFGITVINNALYYIIDAGYSAPSLLIAIGLGGILIVRVLMSLFFHRYPAEWFACR